MIDQDKMRALALMCREQSKNGMIGSTLAQAADAIDLLLAEVEAAAADKRDALTRLLKIVEEDAKWANPRSADWTRGELLATLKIALAQRQGEGS